MTIAERATSNGGDEVVSERLKELLDDVLAGRAPNTGRFCGYCYQPLAHDRTACPHCGRSTSAWAPAEAVPAELIEAHRKRRGREGTVVRAIAWTGLTLGVVLALLPFVFWDVSLWTAGAFFGLLVFFYLLSANLANSVGDALGYRWGRATFERRWNAHVAERDRSA